MGNIIYSPHIKNMYVKPDSFVYLLTGIDLDNNYTNTIFFPQSNIGKTMQEQFFTSHIAYRYNDSSLGNLGALFFDKLYYVRNNSFKVQVAKDALYHVNYMMFKNKTHKDKWFYAFVTDIRYINENTTEIFYQIDVMQTWYFDHEVLDSYIVREHVADDTIGANTVDENLPVPAKIFERVQNCSVHLTGDLSTDNWSHFDEEQYNVGLNHFFKEYAVIVPSSVKLAWKNVAGTGFVITAEKMYGYFYNGVYSGLNLNLLRKYKVNPSLATTYGLATDIIERLTQIVEAGGEETITGIYMAPIMFCKKPTGSDLTRIFNSNLSDGSNADLFDDWFHIHGDTIGEVEAELRARTGDENYWTISDSESCIDYIVKFEKGIEWTYKDNLNKVNDQKSAPKNNKLYTYPFSKLLVTDNAGNSGEFRFEWFKNNSLINSATHDCYFKITCSVVPNPLGQTMPLFYNGVVENVVERVSTDNFPRCAWSVSSFEAWLGKNKTNIVMDTALNAAAIPTQAVMAVAATNYLSKFLAGAGISKGLSEKEKHEQYVTGANVGMLRGTNKFIGNMETDLKAAANALDMPPRVHGETYNSIIFATGNSGFQYYNVRPTDEYCNIIDRYFDMFGYAVKTIKPIKRRNRKLWTYIQTNKCCVKGNLNQDIISELEEIYNNGITFWVAYIHSGIAYNDPAQRLVLDINNYKQANNEQNRQNTPLGASAEI